MSNNLLKASYVTNEGNKTRVIDSNKLVEERIQLLATVIEESTDEDFEAEFAEGLDASQVERLLGEGEEADETEGAHRVPHVDTAAIEQEARERAEEIVNMAKEEAKQIIDDAIAESNEVFRKASEDGYAEGHNKGYTEGLQKNAAMEKQLHEQQMQMDAEYEQKLTELEPMFVDKLTAIYEHVFHVQFAENKDVVFHLIQDAVRKIESSKNFIIHVSKEDFGYVSMQKKSLLAGIANAADIEIIEDMTIGEGECLIETGGGIFDCGLGTQLAGLTKELKLLSYIKE